jgi:hypothetical protein
MNAKDNKEYHGFSLQLLVDEQYLQQLDQQHFLDQYQDQDQQNQQRSQQQ